MNTRVVLGVMGGERNLHPHKESDYLRYRVNHLCFVLLCKVTVVGRNVTKMR